MANDRKFTNNSDTDDYIFDEDSDISFEELELQNEDEDETADNADNANNGSQPEGGGAGRRGRIVRVAIIAAVVIVLAAAGVIVERLVPNNKTVDLDAYYKVAGGNALIYNYDITEYNSIVSDGHSYAQLDFYIDKITDKFYYDSDNQSVIYTTPTSIYTVKAGQKSYDCDGRSTTLEYDPVVIKNDTVYMAVEYAAELEAFTYEIYDNPQRLAIIHDGTGNDIVSLGDKAVVRDKASVKGAVFEKAADNTDTVWCADGAVRNGWIGVMASDGRHGYVRTKYAEVTGQTKEYDSGHTSEEYTSIHKDYDIVMVWHAVYAESDNDKIQSLLEETKGVTTVSPTWYKAIDASGNISSMADWDYISTVHDAGMEIWPLISDFTSTDADAGWDEAALFANTAARRNLISNIINEIETYGYDGINIDFEKVPADSARDYKQFIRELSIECRKAGVVFSLDNYVPRPYNTQYSRAVQAECADYVIVMGYDEHYAGSEEAGSVASISFVTDGIDGTLKEVPKEKVINALPFYTRLWMESVDESGNVKLSSKTYSMQGALDIVAELGTGMEWDDETKQYVAYGDVDGVKYSIWLEEDESIKAKMDVVRDRGLAGVSGWSLGMEKPSVWDIITE